MLQVWWEQQLPREFFSLSWDNFFKPMNVVVDALSTSPMLLLFAVIGLGYLVGSIRIAGFSLGPAAVLFTGIFFGALDSRLRIPDLLYILGLVLFVYTIGLQSGPGFFSSFGPRALKANLLSISMILLAALMSYAAFLLLRLDGPSSVGMFCGALTNTPALAASIDVIKNLVGVSGSTAGGTSAVSAPVIGYGVSYPFGVVGVLLGFYAVARIWEVRKGPAGLSENAEGEGAEKSAPILVRTFHVVNPEAIGKEVSDLLSQEENRGFVLSRLRREGVTSLVYGDTILQEGDLIVAVGAQAAIERARALFGKESARDIHTENQEFDFRRIEVSDKRVVGKTVGELNLQEMLDATVTRIRRGDVDFVPSSDTVLERGDWVRVLTWAGNIDRLRRFFGDSVRSSSETDFLSLSLGLVLGVLIGMIPLPLPGGSRFTLGFAGGPLIVGLILGNLNRTGPIVWGMPFGVNVTLRQVGLVLFLAGVGTKAGDGFLKTVQNGGWELMLAGAVITASVTLVTLLLCVRMLKLSIPAAMGLMSGIQTQPACLAYANEHAATNAPDIWYASVYPVSMISKIILAQLLVGLMM
jgi:putative transport protein